MKIWIGDILKKQIYSKFKAHLKFRFYPSNDRKRNSMSSTGSLSKIKEEFSSNNESSSSQQKLASNKSVISSSKSLKDSKNDDKESKTKNEGQKPTMETQGSC